MDIQQKVSERNIVNKQSISDKKIAKLVPQYLAMEARSAQESENLAYMARLMVIATIPHSKPKSHIFQRTNGDFTLTMVANPKFGLPYGTLPRLILPWMAREAKIKKSPVLSLGKSFSAFLKLLQLNQSGGVRGDATRLREQMLKLFTTHVSYMYQNNKQGVCKADQFSITRSFELWWKPLKAHNAVSEVSTITLAKDFFEELISRPVPVDFRMLQALRRSPLQMDLYVWLTYRLSYLKKPALITWMQLNNQFGVNYANTKQGLRDFKREFLKALHIVTVMYQDAKVEIQDDGLLLKPGKSHIARRKNMGDM